MHPPNNPNNNFQSAPVVYYIAQNYSADQDPPVLQMNNYTSAPPPPPPLQPIYAISYPDNPYGMSSDQNQFAPYKTNLQTGPPSYAEVVQPSRNPPPGPFTPGYKWPRRSIQLVCPKCGATVITRVDRSITCVTIISALILLVLTCFLACIPFCISACKKSTHYCPYCNSMLGNRDALR